MPILLAGVTNTPFIAGAKNSLYVGGILITAELIGAGLLEISYQNTDTAFLTSPSLPQWDLIDGSNIRVQLYELPYSAQGAESIVVSRWAYGTPPTNSGVWAIVSSGGRLVIRNAAIAGGGYFFVPDNIHDFTLTFSSGNVYLDGVLLGVWPEIVATGFTTYHNFGSINIYPDQTNPSSTVSGVTRLKTIEVNGEVFNFTNGSGNSLTGSNGSEVSITNSSSFLNSYPPEGLLIPSFKNSIGTGVTSSPINILGASVIQDGSGTVDTEQLLQYNIDTPSLIVGENINISFTATMLSGSILLDIAYFFDFIDISEILTSGKKDIKLSKILSANDIAADYFTVRLKDNSAASDMELLDIHVAHEPAFVLDFTTTTDVYQAINMSWTEQTVGSPVTYDLVEDGTIIATGVSNGYSLPKFDSTTRTYELLATDTNGTSYSNQSLGTASQVAPVVPVATEQWEFTTDVNAKSGGVTTVNGTGWQIINDTERGSVMENNSDGYLLTSQNQSSTGSYTFTAFIKPSQVTATALIFSRDDSLEPIMFFDNNTLKAGHSDNISRFSVVGVLAVDRWDFVALSFDVASGSLKMYVNSVEVASATGVPGVPAGTSKIKIGNFLTGISSAFTGRMSDARIFETQLSATDIEIVRNDGVI